MHIVERCCQTVRHLPGLRGADWLWDRLRPPYDRVVARLGRKGLRRTINGLDSMLVLPEFRGMAETYEPLVWKHLMSHVRMGDIVADVGAFIGMYTVAIAKRVGPAGRVFAFEPDPANFAALQEHVELNQIAGQVDLVPCAVGGRNGTVPFTTGRGSESSIAGNNAHSSQETPCVSLDGFFAGRRLDILKIDVEGHEEAVINGAMELLGDPDRSPRLIYIEVHPYAWPSAASGESLLRLLDSCCYDSFDVGGKRVERIDGYGEIVAQKSK